MKYPPCNQFDLEPMTTSALEAEECETPFDAVYKVVMGFVLAASILSVTLICAIGVIMIEKAL